MKRLIDIIAEDNNIKDKDAIECTWDKAELEKMIITRGF